jgi:hypothetical protein
MGNDVKHGRPHGCWRAIGLHSYVGVDGRGVWIDTITTTLSSRELFHVARPGFQLGWQRNALSAASPTHRMCNLIGFAVGGCSRTWCSYSRSARSATSIAKSTASPCMCPSYPARAVFPAPTRYARHVEVEETALPPSSQHRHAFPQAVCLTDGQAPHPAACSDSHYTLHWACVRVSLAGGARFQGLAGTTWATW